MPRTGDIFVGRPWGYFGCYLREIEGYGQCVVQTYISNPLLYKGLKFDLRIYALVAGCDPLRLYIYN